jgi:iron complex outermembrane receptor protein
MRQVHDDMLAFLRTEHAGKTLWRHLDAGQRAFLALDFEAAYAEVAKGFQAPSEANSFYVANANLSSINISPQTSTNYQVGTVFKHDQFNADFDVYRIDFKNYAYSGPTDSTGDPSYYGIAKGAYYDGVETQATYSFGGGFSAYVNGSINEAKFKGSKMDMPTVPKRTAAIGGIYDRDGFFGSLMEKYVGSWAVYNTITNPDIPGAGASRSANSTSYWIGDLALGYGQNVKGHSWLKSYKVRLEVGNVFNEKVQVLDTIGASPATAYTTDAFNVLPGRNYFLTVAVEF